MRPEYQGVRVRMLSRIEETGTSQRALSLKIGQDQNYINNVLAGRRPLDLVELVDIAIALGMNPVELLQAGLDFEDQTI